MRFRSGTLQRSVKRWGRFPSFRRQGRAKRVQHSWKYVELNDFAMQRGSDHVVSTILFDSADWQVATGGEGCRNISMDLAIGVTLLPTSNQATTTADSNSIRLGVFVQDQDDPGATDNINEVFADTRALWWAQNVVLPVSLDSEQDSQFVAQQMTWNWRPRMRQRFLKFDEEIRLYAGFGAADVDTAVIDARLWVFGRISWETP